MEKEDEFWQLLLKHGLETELALKNIEKMREEKENQDETERYEQARLLLRLLRRLDRSRLVLRELGRQRKDD